MKNKGPDKNELYKTTICISIADGIKCPYGIRCEFAHSDKELNYWRERKLHKKKIENVDPKKKPNPWLTPRIESIDPPKVKNTQVWNYDPILKDCDDCYLKELLNDGYFNFINE